MSYKRSWLASVSNDLQLLHSVDAFLRSFGSIIDCTAFVRSNPRDILHSIVRICSSADFNLCRSWAPSRAFIETLHTHTCDSCSASFGSRQKLAAHQFRVHGRRGPAHNRLSGTCCPACLLQLHTRPRLLAHVEKDSQRCLQYVLHELPVLDGELLRIADAADCQATRSLRHRGRGRTFAAIPAVTAQGPLPHCAYLLGIGWRNRLNTVKRAVQFS